MRDVSAVLSLSAGLALLLSSPAATSETSELVYYGCYSSIGSLDTSDPDVDVFQSVGACKTTCSDTAVMALTKGTTCYCGSSLPNHEFMLDKSNCSSPCAGYAMDKCGSANGKFYSFYLTGLDDSPAIDSESSSTASIASSIVLQTTSSISTSSATSSASSSASASPSPSSTATASTFDVSNPKSIKAAAQTIADNLMSVYSSSSIPGELPSNPSANGLKYYWWEAGALLGAMVDYWKLTGNDTYNDIVQEGLLWQVGDNNNYQPPNQTLSLGNDDQSTWALSAMTAAEEGFPSGSATKWLDLAIAVSDVQIARWDNATCHGGLRWQVVSTNAGYNFKNVRSSAQFLQLNARLANFTGNQTYIARAKLAQSWLQDAGLISSAWEVFDGVQVTGSKCTDVTKLQWTADAGVLLEGYAYLYNMTTDDTWRNNINGLLSSALKTFASNNNVIQEIACESRGSCNTDQEVYKGQFAAALAQTMRLAPFTAAKILPVLQASATAAYATCDQTGGKDDDMKKLEKLCLSSWSGAQNATTDVSAQLAALMVVQNVLPMEGNTGNSSTPTTSAAAAGSSNTTAATAPNAGSVLQARWSVLMGAPVIALGFIAFG